MDGIPKKSKSAVLYEYNKPLEIREVDILDPEPGAILVKIEAATICGTDVHIWHGEISQISKLPLIMGHELVGKVVKLGTGVKKDAADEPINIGDRIVWAYPWCGKCYWCTIARQPTLCPNMRMYGWGPCNEHPYLTGGFSEYAYVRPECHVIKVPEGIDSKIAASATCAFRTVIHGFERLRGLGIQDTVLILGSGPVGLYALAMAIVSGAAKTIMVGAPKRRLELAKKWGADYIIDIEEVKNPDERKAIILGLTEGRGPDVVIECAGPANAFKEGLDVIRRGGRYLVIGQTDPNPILIHTTNINIKNIEIIGVISAYVPHYYKAMQFLKNNRARFSFGDLISNVYKLEEVNKALESMYQLKEIKPAIVP